MSWSTWLGLASFNFGSLLAQLRSDTNPTPPAEKPAESAYQKARRRCETSTWHAATRHYCLEDAKRLLKPSAPSPKPPSVSEQKLATCGSLGKGPAIAQCRREASKPAESPSPAAPTSKASSLQKELNHCRSLGKSVVVDRCQSQVKKLYAPTPK